MTLSSFSLTANLFNSFFSYLFTQLLHHASTPLNQQCISLSPLHRRHKRLNKTSLHCKIESFAAPNSKQISSSLDLEPVCANSTLDLAASACVRIAKMALTSATQRLIAQFEYTDENVNIGVKEFLRQIG